MYAGGNPVNRIDPTGLEEWDLTEKDVEFCEKQYNIKDNVPLCGAMLAPMHEGDRPNLTPKQKEEFKEKAWELPPYVGTGVQLFATLTGYHPATWRKLSVIERASILASLGLNKLIGSLAKGEGKLVDGKYKEPTNLPNVNPDKIRQNVAQSAAGRKASNFSGLSEAEKKLKQPKKVSTEDIDLLPPTQKPEVGK